VAIRFQRIMSFRVLSLDGGGVRGVFAASVLAHLEEFGCEPLVDFFDLIVGTSTGAIIGLGIAAGIPARDVLNFYREKAPKIFAKPRRLTALLRPKYTNHILQTILKDQFGELTLNDLRVPVCIPSYELAEGVPRVFKSDHNPQLHWGGEQLAWKVAVASSSAPIFFPAYGIAAADAHVDGGLWANNPVLVGISEAVCYFDRDLRDVTVLSIGSGSHAVRIDRTNAERRGLVQWGWNAEVVSVVFAAQAQSAHNIARMLLTDQRYMRIDVEINRPVPMDRMPQATSLIERGANAARGARREVLNRFSP
jgi:patatin-like phospholipase/acyl hydrolase